MCPRPEETNLVKLIHSKTEHFSWSYLCLSFLFHTQLNSCDLEMWQRFWSSMASNTGHTSCVGKGEKMPKSTQISSFY